MKRQHQDSLKVKAAHQCMNGMFTVVIVLLILMAISLLQPIYAQNSLTISLNGQPIIFGETAPVVWEGRTLVPFRRLAEAIGIDVDWQEKTQRITATADGVELVMTVGTRMAVFNGSGREMNAAPQILEGRAFIPLRDFSESFGVQVDYQDGHIAMTYDPILYSVNGKLSGFYALGAGDRSSWNELFGETYPQVSADPWARLFSQVHLGWYEMNEAGELITNGAVHGFRRPSGYEQVLAELENRNIDRTMMIFAQESQGMLAELLSNAGQRAALVETIFSELQTEVFTGVNLDIEGLGLQQYSDQAQQARSGYTAFVTELAERMGNRYRLVVTVPPVNSAYLGYDYAQLGKLVDEMVVMAYDYHDRQQPSATAPMTLVESGVRQLVELVPSEKITLGVRLPAVRYTARPQTRDGEDGELLPRTWQITHPYLHSVYELMHQRSLPELWDHTAKVSYLQLMDEQGNENVIYMESERSLTEKWKLVQRYQLNGVALWRFGAVPDFVYQQLESVFEHQHQ